MSTPTEMRAVAAARKREANRGCMRITVTLPPDVSRYLVAEAQSRGVSRTTIIVAALRRIAHSTATVSP